MGTECRPELINPATGKEWTLGDMIREKLAELFAAPDCGARMDPNPALDANGQPIPGRTEWTVTVRATLQDDCVTRSASAGGARRPE